VGGRLQNANLDYDTRHPILLPKDHPVTKAIIVYYHENYLHGGSQALLAALRQRYWPIALWGKLPLYLAFACFLKVF